MTDAELWEAIASGKKFGYRIGGNNDSVVHENAHWLTCPHRREVINTIGARSAGCGCASTRVDIYRCAKFNEPVLKQAGHTQSCRERILLAAPGYTGRTCRECKVPLETSAATLPIPDSGLTQNLSRGIITGASTVHWPCLGALAIVAHRQQVGLAVADHGLTSQQRGELTRIGSRWIEHDKPDLPTLQMKRRIASDLKAWWKPWVCLASPFDVSAWIDSDAVVIGDLADLFRTGASSPCVSTQRLWQSNGTKIYRELCEKIFGLETCNGKLDSVANINSGVLAWSHEDEILTQWRDWCIRLMSDDDLIVHCRVRDQAGLVVSLVNRQIRGKTLPIMLPDRYNVPADNLGANSSMNRKPISLIPARLLEEATARHPGAVIVHWLGGIKPWKIGK